MKQLGSHWTDFHEIWYLGTFRKYVEKIQVSLKSDKSKGASHADRRTVVITSRLILLRMTNVSHKSCRENQNTHFVFSNFSPRKSCRLWDAEKFLRAEQATEGNVTWRMRIACWITKPADTHSTCNTDNFFTATLVTRTHPNITLHIHCRSFVRPAHTESHQARFTTSVPRMSIKLLLQAAPTLCTHVYSQATQQSSTHPD